MPTDDRAPSVRVTLSEPVPSEAAVGTAVVVRVQVACAAGADRRRMLLQLVAPDGAVTAHAIAHHDGAISETDDVILKVPGQVGEHVWRMVLAAHDAGGARHEECSLPISIRAMPHATSLAVWATPSTVVAGERFAIKVGAKSSADAGLAGRRVDIRDAAGALVASGRLGDTPWPGTSALFWTDLELKAPADPGLVTFSAQFDPAELDIPHDRAASPFSVAIVERPVHTLTVKVIAKETAEPIADAQIRLGAHRAATGPAGQADVRMPKGRYQLQVWMAGYEAPATALDIQADAFVQVEMLTLADDDPDARWKM